MKVNIDESEYGLFLEIKPETLEECNQLLRFARNAKKEPADIYMSIYGSTPDLNISLPKVKKSVQSSSIRPGLK